MAATPIFAPNLMNIRYLTLIASTTMAFVATPATAAIYICPVNGQAVFSSVKSSPLCQESQMDGISEELPTPAAASEVQSSQSSDGITKIWDESEFSVYDDIKILPPATPPKPEIEPDAKVNVKLRNQPKTAPVRNRAPAVVAPVVAVPKPKPQLTRKQILQREVRNEQAALNRAKARLEAAKKSGNSAAIAQYERAVRDREANIRAMQSEMR